MAGIKNDIRNVFSVIHRVLCCNWTDKLNKEEAAYICALKRESNIRRMRLFLIVLLIIQLSNMLVDILTNSHPKYFYGYLGASLFLAVLSVVYLVLIAVKKKVCNGFYLSFWYLFAAGTLVFCVFDLLERGTLDNYVVLAAALAIIPVLSPRESAALIGTVLVLQEFGLLILDEKVFYMQQSAILSVLTFAISISISGNFLSSRLLQRRLRETNEMLDRLSKTDTLTNLLNRRGLYDTAEETLNDNTVMAMIDIDYFKAYNDKFGHLLGDECLKKVADCILQAARYSVVSRYGGEEFVVLFTEKLSLDMIVLLKDLKDAVEHLKIEAGNKKVSEYITVSIGVAKCGSGTMLDNLFAQADQQMYLAKENGRNRIYFEDKLVS